MKETKHDYQGCLCGNFYDSKCTGIFESWEYFKNNYAAFLNNGFDDSYHYVFRYDINKCGKDKYQLELCVMLQRKGIYTHLYIENIGQELLDTEIKEWLLKRKEYLSKLWEIDND